MVALTILAVFIELFTLALHLAPGIFGSVGLGTVGAAGWLAVGLAAIGLIVGLRRLVAAEADKRTGAVIMLLLVLLPAAHSFGLRRSIDLAVIQRVGTVNPSELADFLERHPATSVADVVALYHHEQRGDAMLGNRLARCLYHDAPRLKPAYKAAIISSTLKRIEALAPAVRIEAYRELARGLKSLGREPALRRLASQRAFAIRLHQLPPTIISGFGPGARALVDWLKANPAQLAAGATVRFQFRDALTGKQHLSLSGFGDSCGLLYSWQKAGIPTITASESSVIELVLDRRGHEQVKRYDVHDSRALLRYDPRTGESLGGKAVLKLPYYQIAATLRVAGKTLYQTTLQTKPDAWRELSKPKKQTMAQFQQSIYRAASKGLCEELEKAIGLPKFWPY